MDIKTLSDIEIKAMYYDISASIEVNQKNLQVLNAELENRRKHMEPTAPIEIDNATASSSENIDTTVETPTEEANVAPEATEDSLDASTEPDDEYHPEP